MISVIFWCLTINCFMYHFGASEENDSISVIKKLLNLDPSFLGNIDLSSLKNLREKVETSSQALESLLYDEIQKLNEKNEIISKEMQTLHDRERIDVEWDSLDEQSKEKWIELSIEHTKVEKEIFNLRNTLLDLKKEGTNLVDILIQKEMENHVKSSTEIIHEEFSSLSEEMLDHGHKVLSLGREIETLLYKKELVLEELTKLDPNDKEWEELNNERIEIEHLLDGKGKKLSELKEQNTNIAERTIKRNKLRGLPPNESIEKVSNMIAETSKKLLQRFKDSTNKSLAEEMKIKEEIINILVEYLINVKAFYHNVNDPTQLKGIYQWQKKLVSEDIKELLSVVKKMNEEESTEGAEKLDREIENFQRILDTIGNVLF